jgi:hypothetical protein
MKVDIREQLPHGTLQDRVAAVVLVMSAAIATFFASEHLFGRAANRAETIAMQFAILGGDAYTLDGVPLYLPTNQNRILFPLFLKGLSLFVPAESAYLIARFGSAVLLFAVFWWVLRRLFDAPVEACAAGTLLTAFGLPFTFTYPFEQTSDLLDGALMLLLLAAAWQQRRVCFLIVAAIAAANRESAAFAGILWGFIVAARPGAVHRGREGVFAIAVSIAAYATVIALRFFIAGSRAVGADTQTITGPFVFVEAVAAFIRRPQPTAWPVLLCAALAPAGVWLWSNHASLTRQMRLVLRAAAVIAAVSLLFGVPNELRVLIPSWVLVTIMAAAAHGQRLSSRPRV